MRDARQTGLGGACAYSWSRRSLRLHSLPYLLNFLSTVSAGFHSRNFIALLEPPKRSERLESATPLPGKSRYVEDRTQVGGFAASTLRTLATRPSRLV